MDAFNATVIINVTADTIGKIGAAFKEDQNDDNVLYNAKNEPTNRLRKSDVDNLGVVDLKSVSDVTHRTMISDTAKEESPRKTATTELSSTLGQIVLCPAISGGWNQAGTCIELTEPREDPLQL
ncbi:uncharacterized protein BDZ99DRAFT_527609 [Mytilinidion resinicola]|uniref:Uncharacterized protein n=1 Tax=Mytilinidion resinicola TaxID=574789 RepID=A0A6A6Y104_9PEZI|nr:uncharacterized protein BDZ99DRAFT_527609 [Mytilinidion resinicola]KAF2802238.1 hypothetical protein BDZ99DRAFT_527609 [Mytilinidion resinicola]